MKVTFCFILMEEIWKDIKGYEGLYQVSNLGRVKSLRVKRHKDGILVLGVHNCYPCVFLHKDKKRIWHSVHRLVALAFIPKIEGKDCIDHIDGNTKNNNVSNLRWCTNKENTTFPLAMQHRRESVLGDKNPFFGKKHTEETRKKMSEAKKKRGGIPVCQYTKDGLFIKIWNHAREAGNTLGISPSSITDCCKHKRKSIGGYCWEYYNKKIR